MTRNDIQSNLLWATAGKLVTLAGGLVVGVFVARYLGPRQYGLMNYVISYVTLFQVFATFGMDAIEIREEARCRDDYNRLVGTAFYMRLALAVVTMVAVVLTALFSEADMFTVLLIAIYALSVVGNAFTVVRNYFTALVQNEYIARSEITRTLLGVGIKLVLLWAKAPLIWFVASMTFDIFLLAAGYLLHYRRAVGRPRDWTFDKETVRMYVRESFPLLLTSAAVIIYQRIDQVMIGLMVDKEAVGYFSVAARIVDILVFLPAIIVNTLTPVLVRTRQQDGEKYRQQAQRLTSVTVWATLLAACATSAASYLVIYILFGNTYLQAVPILQVLAFKAVTVALSTTAGHLLVVEGLQRWALLRDGLGCLVCVLLNYLLLQRYGVLASAIVAIASNLAAGYLADALIPPYRHFFVMQTRAIFLGWKDLFGTLARKTSFVVLLVFLLHAFMPVVAHAATLWRDGASPYTIVVATEASPSEQTAAHELQHYLQRISGVTLPVSNNLNTTTPCIYVGYNSRVAALTGAARPAVDDEGFTYRLVGDHIVIYGGSRRGTMYGVFALLEDELGVRWYTRDCTVVPRKTTWTVHSLHSTQSPAIPYRYTMYYGCADNAQWSAHNRNNFTWGHTDNQYGGTEACLGAHTLAQLLPREEFAATHPEYFALRDGKRVTNGQPCLSHPDVLRIVTQRLMQRIAQHPGYLYYDVSQLDNQLYCQCERCRQIERRYGDTHSGIMLWFVNQVADEVARVYPDKMLCTFAYQYTRQAPKNIRPRTNVTIRLCDIECCFAHPLETCQQNRAFMADLRDWARLTRHIFIWDYVVNFHNYIAPYPNFDVLRPNIQTFVRLGVATVLEQGQRESDGGEWAELKAWVIAHLLWNPQRDAMSLAHDFINGYYGTAAPYVRQYFNLCRRQVRPATHIYQNGDEKMTVYTDAFVTGGMRILDRALAHAKDPVTRGRVERLQSQMLDIKTKLSPMRSRIDGTATRYEEYLKRTRPYVREGRKYE